MRIRRSQVVASCAAATALLTGCAQALHEVVSVSAPKTAKRGQPFAISVMLLARDGCWGAPEAAAQVDHERREVVVRGTVYKTAPPNAACIMLSTYPEVTVPVTLDRTGVYQLKAHVMFVARYTSLDLAPYIIKPVNPEYAKTQSFDIAWPIEVSE